MSKPDWARPECRWKGFRILRLCEYMGWSKQRLADEIGVHGNRITSWTSGGRPSVENEFKLDEVARRVHFEC